MKPAIFAVCGAALPHRAERWTGFDCRTVGRFTRWPAAVTGHLAKQLMRLQLISGMSVSRGRSNSGSQPVPAISRCREQGEFGFLHAVPCGGGRRALGFLQCLNDSGLADAAEIIPGIRREPRLHVEGQRLAPASRHVRDGRSRGRSPLCRTALTEQAAQKARSSSNVSRCCSRHHVQNFSGSPGMRSPQLSRRRSISAKALEPSALRKKPDDASSSRQLPAWERPWNNSPASWWTTAARAMSGRFARVAARAADRCVVRLSVSDGGEGESRFGFTGGFRIAGRFRFRGFFRRVFRGGQDRARWPPCRHGRC